MNKPRKQGESVDAYRVNEWIDRFEGYRTPIRRQQIENWMRQFESKHEDLAARVLDAVEFISHADIAKAFKALLASIPGWHKKPSKRKGNWYFIGLGPPGSRGPSMLTTFRAANGLDVDALDHLFIHVTELVEKSPGPGDTVVFVDDFAGSGDQVCSFWERQLAELITDNPKVYLLLVGASQSALNRIRSDTSLSPMAHRQLLSTDNLFSEDCPHFSNTDRTALLPYCRRADKKQPHGYGGCGFLVVLAHKCPNNSLPVLHASNSKFQGLFPRALIV